MEPTYQPQKIEHDTQRYWQQKNSFVVTESSQKPKFYCLSMLPYPSGQLHMGHVRNYTIGDVISRYQRMMGKNVLQPMGWDAFGLPAENAAIKHKLPPAQWTYSNIENMRNQLKRLGFAYDWTRELATCDPNYYRFEQWLFTRLVKKGLAYRKMAVVNWDPVDQTVLANEQVIDGRGWRSGALIERREIPQWFLKITDYAHELLAEIDNLTAWPEQVRTMQKNWIGRSEGLEILFQVEHHHDPISIFTTRPDTLMGATYVAIAPQHPLALELAEKSKAIAQFVEECQHIKTAEAELATLEKKGIDTGLKAIHPISKELIPIWIANFVVMDYGSGAVMSVPAHDERDFEFAKKYGLPIKQVIKNDQINIDLNVAAYTEQGTLINSKQFDGLNSEQAKKEISDFIEQQKLGKRKINYRLRDWGISRQRYWGAPIPIIYCEKCDAVPVPEKDLPVVLPEDVPFSGTTSPLKTMPEFYETTCPQCGGKAKRETDTFDTFIESSWYYARYTCVDQKQKMLDERANYWTPVDCYIGGIEHAVLHLLYARFFHKLLRDEGLVDSNEPFTRLITQGMVLKDGSKMSKSKGNIVDPQALIEKFGADTVRLFMMFAAPPELALEWSDSGVEGAHRFLKRLWSFCHQQQETLKKINAEHKAIKINSDNLSKENKKLRQQIHQVIRQALQDYERTQFNTVVSAGMKLLNILIDDVPKELRHETQLIVAEATSILLRLLYPIVPHITHVLWQDLGFGADILESEWPTFDESALQLDVLQLVIQVNGKLRGQIEVDANADAKTIEKLVLNHSELKRWLGDKSLQKVIVVPGRLINIVAK